MTTIIYDRAAMSIYVCGHAGSAPAGKDIVCAGISALSEAMIHRVRGRGIWQTIMRIDSDKPAVFVKLRPKNRRAEDLGMELLETICGGYLAIAEEYPDCVKVEVR